MLSGIPLYEYHHLIIHSHDGRHVGCAWVWTVLKIRDGWFVAVSSITACPPASLFLCSSAYKSGICWTVKGSFPRACIQDHHTTREQRTKLKWLCQIQDRCLRSSAPGHGVAGLQMNWELLLQKEEVAEWDGGASSPQLALQQVSLSVHLGPVLRGSWGKEWQGTGSICNAAPHCSSRTSYIENMASWGRWFGNWKRTLPRRKWLSYMQIFSVLPKSRNCEFWVKEAQVVSLCDRIGHSMSFPHLTPCRVHCPLCYHQPRRIGHSSHFLGHCSVIPPVARILTQSPG